MCLRCVLLGLAGCMLVTSACSDNRLALGQDAALGDAESPDARAEPRDAASSDARAEPRDAEPDAAPLDAALSDAATLDAPSVDGGTLGCGTHVFPDAIIGHPYVVPVSELFPMPFARFLCGIGTIRPAQSEEDPIVCTFSITDTLDKIITVKIWDANDMLVLDCSALIHVVAH